MVKHLNQYITQNFTAYGHIQAGATMKAVLDAALNNTDVKMLSKTDYLVLIGGTNDVASSFKMNTLLSYLETQVKSLNNTNIILSTVPYRYDCGHDELANRIIKELNIGIRMIAYKYSHVQILDLYLLPSEAHTRHGLHINNKGKSRMAKQIIELIKKSDTSYAVSQTSLLMMNKACSLLTSKTTQPSVPSKTPTNRCARKIFGDSPDLVVSTVKPAVTPCSSSTVTGKSSNTRSNFKDFYGHSIFCNDSNLSACFLESL